MMNNWGWKLFVALMIGALVLGGCTPEPILTDNPADVQSPVMTTPGCKVYMAYINAHFIVVAEGLNCAVGIT